MNGGTPKLNGAGKIKDRLKQFDRDFQSRSLARLRLPRWAALLQVLTGLFCWGCATLFFFFGAYEVHKLLHPGLKPSGAAFALMFFASFFGSIAPAFMAANLALWVLPATRRVLDEAARGIQQASFQDSMRDLSRIARVAAPLGLALALLGAVEPWAY